MIDNEFPTKISVVNLIENHSNNTSCVFEHGLSLYVEVETKTDKFTFLTDSGQSGAFIDNATALGIDLNKTDYMFISHNHYDHVGGLRRLLTLNKHIKIVASKNCLSSTFKVLNNSDTHQIGLKGGAAMEDLKEYPKYIGGFLEVYNEFPKRFILIDDDKYKLSENIFIIKPQKSEPEFVCKDLALAKLENNRIMKDDFEHELFAVIENEHDIILISSCSHCGIVNIASTAFKIFKKPVKTIVGGFHMRGKDGDYSLNCDREFIIKTAQRLIELGCEKIYTGHCTGIAALEILRETLGKNVTHFKTGDTFTCK